MLEELIAMSARRYVPPHNIALVYQGLGEVDEALAWLERAFQERDVRLSFLKINPNWDRLRPHPRFKAILRGMNLG